MEVPEAPSCDPPAGRSVRRDNVLFDNGVQLWSQEPVPMDAELSQQLQRVQSSNAIPTTALRNPLLLEEAHAPAWLY